MGGRLEYFRKSTAPLLTYGRMSLTNYVSQSVIGSLIFFPYALGMAPYCGYLVSFAVGFAAMTGQIWFCRWWLERHRYGGLEGLWDRATGRREGFRSGTPVRNGGRRNDVSRYLWDDF